MSELARLTKDEIAEEIMDLVALDLESLSRMTKSDLIKLHHGIQELGAESSELLHKPLEEILDQRIGDKRVRDLTLGEIVTQVRDRGPLGLGILPELRHVWRNEVKPEIRRLLRRERGKRT